MKAYLPKPGTLAQLVVLHLQANPPGELLLAEIVQMFQVKSGNVHSLLHRACEADLLCRQRNEAKQTLYRLGGVAGQVSDVYKPRAKSLAARVLRHFADNPYAVLTRDRIAELFCMNRPDGVYDALRDAVGTGLLRRQLNSHMVLEYRAVRAEAVPAAAPTEVPQAGVPAPARIVFTSGRYDGAELRPFTGRAGAMRAYGLPSRGMG